MPTYPRAPVEFVRGEGARLWDADGTEYLDFFAGLSVHNAGHCHPRIVAAIREQAGASAGPRTSSTRSPRCGSASGSPSPASAAGSFLCNSGTEANECAIKLVRKRAHARGIDRAEIVVLDGAFHGRTLGALAATPRLAREDLFGPLPRRLRRRPARRSRGAARRGRRAHRGGDDRADPGRGGRLSDRRRGAGRGARGLRRAAARCWSSTRSRPEWGRTGSLWAYEQLPVRPDVMTTAQGARWRPAGRRLRDVARARRGARARRARLDVRRRPDRRRRGAGRARA